MQIKYICIFIFISSISCLKIHNKLSPFRLNFEFFSQNVPKSNVEIEKYTLNKKIIKIGSLTSFLIGFPQISNTKADAPPIITDANQENFIQSKKTSNFSEFNLDSIKIPYNRENFPFKEFLGKATIVLNMKLDDPQTATQFPAILEIYKKYSKDGLAVLVFPTEQGYFEPDDDETCRLKAKEYYGFGDYPRAVVFDKVDILGPSANPLYTGLTNSLLTPNGYGRITLNYEKFLLDSNGVPLRRYPRKFSAFDMETDIASILKDGIVPNEGPGYDLYLKSWREAKREAVKSEYAFRYNYNYYTAPDSMYKYNPSLDTSTTKENATS